jgi:hypothetical protein
MSVRLKIRNVRFSYMNVFKARSVDAESTPKFSVSLIIPKDHPQLAEIKAAIKSVVEEKWPDPKKRPPGLHVPIRDGDSDPARSGDPAYAGAFFIGANAMPDSPPAVVDPQAKKVEDHSFWVSGDYGHASVDFYAFDRPIKRGVAAGLRGVQFISKGEPLSARGNVYADFSPEEGTEETPSGTAWD